MGCPILPIVMAIAIFSNGIVGMQDMEQYETLENTNTTTGYVNGEEALNAENPLSSNNNREGYEKDNVTNQNISHDQLENSTEHSMKKTGRNNIDSSEYLDEKLENLLFIESTTEFWDNVSISLMKLINDFVYSNDLQGITEREITTIVFTNESQNLEAEEFITALSNKELEETTIYWKSNSSANETFFGFDVTMIPSFINKSGQVSKSKKESSIITWLLPLLICLIFSFVYFFEWLCERYRQIAGLIDIF